MAMVVTPSNGQYGQTNEQVRTDSGRVNKEGKFVYIKYHFLAEHGQKQFTDPEAIRMSGENPDYSKQQLWEHIEDGKEVVWKANVQIMQPEDADAEKLGFDPFDVTKVWPRDQFPVCYRSQAHVPHRVLTISDARVRPPCAQQESGELSP